MTQTELQQLLSADGTQSKLDNLDEKEFELFSLMSRGTPTRFILDEMGLTAEELAEVKKQVQKKLGIKNEIALLQFAAKNRARDL